ncbi:hypothetical protein Hanom_Chr16g01491401 [Helianthus anomalus]
MTRAKQIQNASDMKRSKNNGDSPSWSHPIHDFLFLVIRRLGVVDFIAFSALYKSWRTVALSTRKMFMLSDSPWPYESPLVWL